MNAGDPQKFTRTVQKKNQRWGKDSRSRAEFDPGSIPDCNVKANVGRDFLFHETIPKPQPPGAQTLLAYAPGSTNTAFLSSRELKHCLPVLPVAQILMYFICSIYTPRKVRTKKSCLEGLSLMVIKSSKN